MNETIDAEIIDPQEIGGLVKRIGKPLRFDRARDQGPLYQAFPLSSPPTIRSSDWLSALALERILAGSAIDGDKSESAGRQSETIVLALKFSAGRRL